MMARRLRLPALLSSGCQALLDLTDWIRERGARAEWFDMVEREDGMLLSIARITSDQRQEAKPTKAPKTKEATNV